MKFISSSTDCDFTILHIWILAQRCDGRCLWQICLPDREGQCVCSWSVRSPVLSGSCNLPALTSAASVPVGKGCTAVVGPDISDLRNYFNIEVSDNVVFLIFKERKGIWKSCRGICAVWIRSESKQNIFTCWQHGWVQRRWVQRPPLQVLFWPGIWGWGGGVSP